MDITEVFITQEISVANQTKGSAISGAAFMSITENEIHTAVKKRTNGEIIENAADMEDMATWIQDEYFEPLVSELRGLDESEWSDFKKTNFSGFFPSQYINEDGKYQHNDIIQIDIDPSDIYTTEYIAQLKTRLAKHKNIFMAFNSVTTGLKVFVKTNLPANTSAKLHRKAYFEVVNHLSLPTLRDNCGQEIGRFCYLSSDKDIIYNPDCEILELDITGLEEEIKQLELLKTFDIDVKEYNNSEILTAFEFISRQLNYEERLEVNFAMFAIFGSAAFSLLEGKWDVDDRQKLEGDLVMQLKANKREFNAGTIFHYGHLGGYKPLLHNRNIKETTRPSKYSFDNLLTLEKGEYFVKNKVARFFKGISQFLNVSLGLGKTRETIKQCIANIDKNIDILLDSHERCEEYIQVFIELKGAEWATKNVIHMKGRDYTSASDKRNCLSDKIEHDVKSLNRGKFCKKCPLQENCSYVQQFKGNQSIRLYTHNHLYQHSSNWDTRIASHVIVDENIISKMATADISTSELSCMTETLNGGKSIEEAIKVNYRKLEEVAENKYTNYSANTQAIAHILYSFAKKLQIDPTAEFDYHYEPYETGEAGKVKSWIKIYRSHPIHKKYDNAAFLFLDGTGNESLVKKIFGDIEYTEIKVKKDDSVKVTQHACNTFSRAYLKENDVIDLLKGYCKGHSNIGLITYQHLHEDGDNFYSEMAKKIGAKECGYFGAIRGTNRFIDCDLLIILGRHQIGASGVETMYRNLHSKDCNNTEQVIGSDVWMGHEYENQVYTYLDPELQAIADFTNNSETEQAIGRARSIRNNGKKKVLILNNVVFNIEVDELIVKNITAKEEKLIEELHKYIKANDFLVATNKRMAEAINLNVRRFEDFNKHLVTNDLISLETVEYKSNGKFKNIDIYCFDDYIVNEDDIRTHIKSKRPLKIIRII